VRFLLLLCLLLAEPLTAAAQNSFRHPIRILVPLPAGSTSDVVARFLADGLEKAVGQPIIVENKPGASGRIAAEALKRSAPDGSRFLLAPIAVVVLVPLVFKDVPYDPAKDFAPVAQVAEFQYAIAVRPDHPARTLPELVGWARANTAQASFGTPGAGSVPHLFGTMMARGTGVDFVHVAYKGAPQLAAELISGQVGAGISALSDLIALHRAGRLRILATSGARRSALAPDVATFKEHGFPGVEGTGWTALFAPAGTPRPVIDYWSAAVMAALRVADLRERLIGLGIEPTGTTPEALATIIAADTARWVPIARAAGLKAE